jgi:hypothetical protein
MSMTAPEPAWHPSQKFGYLVKQVKKNAGNRAEGLKT